MSSRLRFDATLTTLIPYQRKTSRTIPKGASSNRKDSPAAAESSEFDSSDSENDTSADEKVVAAPPKTQLQAAPEPSSVLEPSPQTAAKQEEQPVVPVVAAVPAIGAVGSALRRGADGQVLGPRVVERKPKIKVSRFRWD